jgi:hypothetical protein
MTCLHDGKVEPAGCTQVPRGGAHDQRGDGAEHETDDQIGIKIPYRDHILTRGDRRSIPGTLDRKTRHASSRTAPGFPQPVIPASHYASLSGTFH